MNTLNRFTVTAHTGCENTADNSIESADKAFESGADIFEVDVNFDEKGIPVLSHDAPVGGEIQLEEIFKRMKNYEGMLCNLDIKSTDNLKSIPVLAEKYGVIKRIFYTGIHDDFVESAKNDTPEISYYLNVALASPEEHTAEYVEGVIDKVRKSGAVGINCNYTNATAELVKAFHKNNFSVSLWTVNDEAEMLKVTEMKPDNITTRYPATLKLILSKK